MPIYEYGCGKCGHEFEAEQRITDAPLKTCPACRSRKVRRLISRTSFVLKGGGWYSDLYASPGGKKSAAAAESGDKPSGEVAPEAGPAAEAKPAAEAGPAAEAKPAAGDAKPAGSRTRQKGKKKGPKAAA